METTGLIRGWQEIVSAVKNPEGGGWLVETAAGTAYWDTDSMPSEPLLAFLRRTQNGEYVARGIYDSAGFVHQCSAEKETVVL
jgi:hypothetical protein